MFDQLMNHYLMDQVRSHLITHLNNITFGDAFIKFPVSNLYINIGMVLVDPRENGIVHDSTVRIYVEDSS